jgi:hypothetical protein
MIEYEDGDVPEIAIAPPGYSVPLATMWVRSHHEPMILRDPLGHCVLLFESANGSVQVEGPAFWRITDRKLAAEKMRQWIDSQDLIQYDESDS